MADVIEAFSAAATYADTPVMCANYCAVKDLIA